MWKTPEYIFGAGTIPGLAQAGRGGGGLVRSTCSGGTTLKPAGLSGTTLAGRLSALPSRGPESRRRVLSAHAQLQGRPQVPAPAAAADLLEEGPAAVTQ